MMMFWWLAFKALIWILNKLINGDSFMLANNQEKIQRAMCLAQGIVDKGKSRGYYVPVGMTLESAMKE